MRFGRRPKHTNAEAAAETGETATGDRAVADDSASWDAPASSPLTDQAAPQGTTALRIDVLSIFPELITQYTAASIVGRAQEKSLVSIRSFDLRDGATDARRTIDDTPFGGGAGMVFRPEPVFAAVEQFEVMRPIYLLSPGGHRFDHDTALQLASSAGFTLLCGRYEGIDQRIIDHLVTDEISIGDYVLAGGELGALVVIEAVTRLIPGVLGNNASAGEESFSNGLLEYPHYTRPAVFREISVPQVLQSGDHGRIDRWRHAAALSRTLDRRPDLIDARGGLSAADAKLLAEHGYPY